MNRTCQLAKSLLLYWYLRQNKRRLARNWFNFPWRSLTKQTASWERLLQYIWNKYLVEYSANKYWVRDGTVHVCFHARYLTETGFMCYEHKKELLGRLTRLAQIKWENRVTNHLRTVPTIVNPHMFCASRDTRVSYRWCLLIQEYFCAV